jgi:UDP-N-acetylglucosamine diphosphorylase / glucose-1-phosphate thymidylyltransferase / UDP-N-acetylgalactosamine diphosphorylase / glucosamine-1-phosphate N-acetyltransferase / galactosamine-1-phosphate N-acetyltransferase
MGRAEALNVIVVVPMAGRGSRFSGPEAQGLPKPLVRVAGKPMIEWALRSLEGLDYTHIAFVVLSEHEERFGVTCLLRGLAGEEAIVRQIPDVTQGQLCTVLEVADLIDRDEDLLIASSDTYVVSELGRDLAGRTGECRGIISVSEQIGDHWSFARLGPEGNVVEVAEKRRISPLCSTGLYWFASAKEFIRLAKGMVARDERTRGEFFVTPLYGKMIEMGLRVDVSVASAVWDMGTPEAAARFESTILFQANGSVPA